MAEVYRMQQTVDMLEPKELTGEADIDISEADYTAFVEILKIEPKTGGPLIDLTVDLDFMKATTGFDAVATADDTLDIAVFGKIDGTNWRHLMSATQVTATGSHTTAAERLKIGNVGPGCDISIRAKVSTERGDVEIPYRITYRGVRAPDVTAVAAA